MKDQVCPFTSGNVKQHCPSKRDHGWLFLELSAFFKHFLSLRRPFQSPPCGVYFAYSDFLYR